MNELDSNHPNKWGTVVAYLIWSIMPVVLALVQKDPIFLVLWPVLGYQLVASLNRKSDTLSGTLVVSASGLTALVVASSPTLSIIALVAIDAFIVCGERDDSKYNLFLNYSGNRWRLGKYAILAIAEIILFCGMFPTLIVLVSWLTGACLGWGFFAFKTRFWQYEIESGEFSGLLACTIALVQLWSIPYPFGVSLNISLKLIWVLILIWDTVNVFMIADHHKRENFLPFCFTALCLVIAYFSIVLFELNPFWVGSIAQVATIVNFAVTRLPQSD